jgi:hypothetical protein
MMALYDEHEPDFSIFGFCSEFCEPHSAAYSATVSTSCGMVFDTGCNRHVTQDESILHNYRALPATIHAYIGYAGAESQIILGYGDIVFMSKVGRRQLRTVIPDVALVSQARRTLIAWQRFLIETHCHIMGDHESIALYRNGHLHTPMSHSNGLLILQGHAVRRNEACLADGEIWHERVGHASAKQMRILADRHLKPAVTGNPEHIAHCIGCTKGRLRRAPRGQSSVRDHSDRLAPGQRIHCDIVMTKCQGTHACVAVVR